MYHFNISPNLTCIVMNTCIIIQLCMVICYHLVIYAYFVYINGMNHINQIKWYMEMQYNDIQIIIKQYGRTGIHRIFLFVYFLQIYFKSNFEYRYRIVYLKFGRHRIPYASTCVAKTFEYILILLLLTCSKCFCLVV